MTNALNIDSLMGFGQLLSFILVYMALFLVSGWIKDILTPSYKINHELTQKNNLAVCLMMCGYYFAVTAIFIGSLFGPSNGALEDIINISTYSLAGIILLNCSRIINDKLILRQFCNMSEMIEKHNISVASVQFGSYVATGLIAGASVLGEDGGMLTFMAFFILGQLSLVLFSMIYQVFLGYNLYEELGKNNIAAGISFGATLVALGIIIINGIIGNFISWQESLIGFALTNLVAFIFLPIARLFMDKLIIPGASLFREIKEDQNIGVSLLEGIVVICFSLILNIIF